jgi:hypothetical protein
VTIGADCWGPIGGSGSCQGSGLRIDRDRAAHSSNLQLRLHGTSPDLLLLTLDSKNWSISALWKVVGSLVGRYRPALGTDHLPAVPTHSKRRRWSLYGISGRSRTSSVRYRAGLTTSRRAPGSEEFARLALRRSSHDRGRGPGGAFHGPALCQAGTSPAPLQPLRQGHVARTRDASSMARATDGPLVEVTIAERALCLLAPKPKTRA